MTIKKILFVCCFSFYYFNFLYLFGYFVLWQNRTYIPGDTRLNEAYKAAKINMYALVYIRAEI